MAEDPQPEAEVEPEAVSTKTTKADVKEMQASCVFVFVCADGLSDDAALILAVSRSGICAMYFCSRVFSCLNGAGGLLLGFP